MLAMIGFTFTAIWIAVAAWYVWSIIGLENFWSLMPNEAGDFFAGFFAPLFFVWLIIGYFQQNKELRQNNLVLRQQAKELKLSNEALRQQAEQLERAAHQAERQAKAVAANELHARRDTFFRVAELLTQELLSTSQKILDFVGHPHMDNISRRHSAGYRQAYFDAIVTQTVGGREKEFMEKVDRTMNGREYLSKYCSLFEVLLKECESCDEEGELGRIFESSTMGDVYWVFCTLIDRQSQFRHRSP